jgi:hypothetical protein
MIEITVITLFVFAVLFVVFLTKSSDKPDDGAEDTEAKTGKPPDKRE